MLSVYEPPSDPAEIERWLLTREEEIAEVVVARLTAIIDEASTAFTNTLTAAGDMSVFDSVPIEWSRFVTQDLGDRLGGMYLSGGVSAWIQSPGTDALPESTAQTWTNVVNENAVSYASQATNRLTGPVADSIWNDLRLKVSKAIETGMSTERLTQEIALNRDFAIYRAQMIARTEVNGAYNAGNYQSNQALGDMGPVEKYWVATGDDRTRQSHREADGQVRAFDQPFIIGGSEMMYPHDPSGPASEVINCFIGSTPMEWIGDLQAITRRWYEGDLYQIITANGERLTVTPNHPILTVAGWKTAKEINLKEQLFRIGSSPQVDHMPASIEQIYRTASKSRSQVRKGLGPMDFHGDALDGEVEIVGTDSDLLAILDSHGIEIRRQIVLARSDKLLEPFPDESSLVRSLLSQFGTLGNGTRYPTSLIGDRDQFSTLLLAQSRHSDVVRLGAGTDRQVVSAKPTDDGGPRYAESFSKGQDTHALTVETTEVVGISRFPAACHVYNLQSSTGLLISGNLISHNCRCVTAYLYPGMTRPDGTIVPASPEALAREEAGTLSPGQARTFRSIVGEGTPTGQPWIEDVPRFESVDEAERWLQRRWSQTYRGEARDIRYGRINLEAAQVFTEDADYLFRTFPDVADNVVKIGSSNAFQVNIGNSLGVASRLNRALYWNETRLSVDDWPDTLIRAKRRNWFSTDARGGTLYHEFGHHIGFEIEARSLGNPEFRMSNEKYFKTGLSPILKRVLGLKGSPGMSGYNTKVAVAQSLSKYGSTDWHEFIAESFAESMAGEINGTEVRPLAQAVREWLDSELARVVS